MVAIHIFYTIELGGTNMKKKKIVHRIYHNSEVSEREYQQKLKVDQSILQMFFNSFSQYFCVPFYPYIYTLFSQTDRFVNQLEVNEHNRDNENNEDKEDLKQESK